MVPLAANIPLTLCSVVLRRFFDSYSRHLTSAVVSSTVPTASTVALFSGALVCLYNQLQRGTLVKIGLGKGISSLIRNSRHTIQALSTIFSASLSGMAQLSPHQQHKRRVKNNSWFLRNLASCRRKCCAAVFKITQPSCDSLERIQAETGSIEAGNIGETTSLPVFNRRCIPDSRRNVRISEGPPLENLYSNESFEPNNYSVQDVLMDDSKRNESRTRKSVCQVTIHSPHRPVTRHFRKSMAKEDGRGDARRVSSKKKRKPDHTMNDTDHAHVTTAQVEERTQVPKRALPKLKVQNVRLSKDQPKIQKIISKTRSGRVYAYRL